MNQEQEIELLKDVAILNKQAERDYEAHIRLDKKLDLILVKINEYNSDTFADIHSLKHSLKMKIGESIGVLRAKHDEDMEVLKTFSWLGNHRKILIIIGIMFFIAFYNQIVPVVTNFIKKQGIELRDTHPHQRENTKNT